MLERRGEPLEPRSRVPRGLPHDDGESKPHSSRKKMLDRVKAIVVIVISVIGEIRVISI